MAPIDSNKSIFLNETERKPNLYASNVLIAITAVVAIVYLFNELNIFQLNKELVYICLGASVLQSVAVRFIVHSPKMVEHPAAKFVIMSIILLLVLTLTVLLNIHAVLAFGLPILLATQYRSYNISNLALIGSIACCVLAPVLSYLLGTWNLNFMTGYIQTFCNVTITASPGNGIEAMDAIAQIILYWALPQMLSLGAYGIILYSATKSSIKSVKDQLQVEDLGRDLGQRQASIIAMQEKVLYAMSDIIENRDMETGDHVRRTSGIVRAMTDAMRNDPGSGVTEEFCNMVIKSAPLHDLGKIAVPDSILRKTEPLTDEEYEIIKLHPIRSAEIISKALTGVEDEQLIATAQNLARYHHERVDGKGYPEGLSGKDIPLEARIMAIADVYDALVSERCYKAAMSPDEAFDTIHNAMGTQFDADLDRYFMACRKDIETFYDA